jgi:hypothetical protein
VSCVLQTDKVRDKVKQTCLEKYGVSTPLLLKEVREKRKHTIVQKYGIVNYMESSEFKEKKKNTMLEKYGVEHALQNLELFEKQQKSSYSSKKYTLPSGKIITIQGFEHFALNELLKTNNEESIKIGKKDVPKIEYSENNKYRVYFPDIFIPSENKIIEIKSEWTFKKDENLNYLKWQACITKGYTFSLWIYDKYGNKQEYHLENGGRVLSSPTSINTAEK